MVKYILGKISLLISDMQVFSVDMTFMLDQRRIIS